MSKVIAIMQNKGGTLKTTLTTNLASTVALQGRKVLIIDLDPQGNVASSYGINQRKLESTIKECIIDQNNISKSIIHTELKNLDIIPSNQTLSTIEIDVISGRLKIDLLKRFKNLIDTLRETYDFILFDTAPAMNTFAVLPMRESNEILIPMQMERYALDGLVTMIENARKYAPKAKITIIPTLFDSRTKLHNEILEQIKQLGSKHKIPVTNIKITKSVKAAKAVAYQHKPLTLVRGNSKQKIQYHSLAFELGYKEYKNKGVK